jgi:hypothetical protein
MQLGRRDQRQGYHCVSHAVRLGRSVSLRGARLPSLWPNESCSILPRSGTCIASPHAFWLTARAAYYYSAISGYTVAAQLYASVQALLSESYRPIAAQIRPSRAQPSVLPSAQIYLHDARQHHQARHPVSAAPSRAVSSLVCCDAPRLHARPLYPYRHIATYPPAASCAIQRPAAHHHHHHRRLVPASQLRTRPCAKFAIVRFTPAGAAHPPECV